MTKRVQLRELARARSGDKGADANIGVWAEDEHTYEFLVGYLTAERVEGHFRALRMTGVQRYELPNIKALNFVLTDALDGGGTVSLRTDAQGKTLSLGLLHMMVDAPDELLR